MEDPEENPGDGKNPALCLCELFPSGFPYSEVQRRWNKDLGLGDRVNMNQGIVVSSVSLVLLKL